MLLALTLMPSVAPPVGSFDLPKELNGDNHSLHGPMIFHPRLKVRFSGADDDVHMSEGAGQALRNEEAILVCFPLFDEVSSGVGDDPDSGAHDRLLLLLPDHLQAHLSLKV